MRYATFLLFAGLFTATAFAQRVSFGVKAGMRLNDDLESGGEGVKVPESKRYTLGPTVEFKLPHRLSLEIDALYKRLGTSSYSMDFAGDWGYFKGSFEFMGVPNTRKISLATEVSGPLCFGRICIPPYKWYGYIDCLLLYQSVRWSVEPDAYAFNLLNEL